MLGGKNPSPITFPSPSSFFKVQTRRLYCMELLHIHYDLKFLIKKTLSYE